MPSEQLRTAKLPSKKVRLALWLGIYLAGCCDVALMVHSDYSETQQQFVSDRMLPIAFPFGNLVVSGALFGSIPFQIILGIISYPIYLAHLFFTLLVQRQHTLWILFASLIILVCVSEYGWYLVYLDFPMVAEKTG